MARVTPRAKSLITIWDFFADFFLLSCCVVLSKITGNPIEEIMSAFTIFLFRAS